MSPNLPPFYHDVHKRVTYYCIAISFIYCFFTCWYHNNLFIFFSDNQNSNMSSNLHMFIYHNVSIFFSSTKIYPLQGQESRDQPGLVNQPSRPSSSSLIPSQPTISIPSLPSQAPTSDVAAIDSSVEQPSMPSFKCVESL